MWVTEEPLEALLQIMQLHVRYAYFFDSGAVEGLADCFTEQAVFDSLPSVEGLPFPATGRQAIVDALASERQPLDSHPYLHLVGNPLVVEYRLGYFRTWTQLVVFHTLPGTAPTVRVTGGYDDEIVLEEDRQWRLSRRTTYRDLAIAPTFELGRPQLSLGPSNLDVAGRGAN